MADKQMQKGKVNSPNARQIGIGVAFVIVVIILIWQLWGIFGASTPAPPPPQSPTTHAGTTPGTPPTAPAHPMEEQPELSRGKITNEPSFIKMQKATEEKYVTKLNELEELRIQRQIAETNQAIAAAKLATVTAEKDISDLLTRPAAPQVPASEYAAQLVTPTTTGGNVVPVVPPPVSIADYTLISVSMQLHKWSAVLGLQGKLFNVGIGDVLPDDSTVASINRSSVVLKKDGEIRKITIVSSI